MPLSAIERIQQAGAMAAQHIRSLRSARKFRGELESLERYCMFLGYPRSSHTLAGAVLDAHPEMVVAHELDVFRHLGYGFTSKQIYRLLIERSEWFAAGGWQWMGYSYGVPNQWQGRYRRLRVIGDKKGGASTRQLATRPDLLDRLRKLVKIPVKILHVIRNPYDNIATMALRGKHDAKGVDRDIEEYFRLSNVVARVKTTVDSVDWCDVRSESFVASPREHIQRLCGFLGVDVPADYLADCASIFFPSARKSRDKVQWTPKQIAAVAREMEKYPFLHGYGFHEVRAAG